MISLQFISVYRSASFVAIGALMAYVLFYGMGLGPIPFMIATGKIIINLMDWLLLGSNFIEILSYLIEINSHIAIYYNC